jgi:hypothetical protein
MLPVVGLVILESIFRSVDFPAPFLPITAKISPSLSSKLISFSAQYSLLCVCCPIFK